jgi:hypothetical protein
MWRMLPSESTSRALLTIVGSNKNAPVANMLMIHAMHYVRFYLSFFGYDCITCCKYHSTSYS